MIAESSPFPWFSTARRRTRRIVVVAYWLLALGLCGLNVWAQVHRAGNLRGLALLFPLQILVFLPAILGGVRAGGMVKPFDGVRWAPLDDRDDTQTLFGAGLPIAGSMSAREVALDEREQRQRDRVHFFSYTFARWLALLLLACECCAGIAWPAWLPQCGAAAFLLLALVLWSLPQTLILWTAPDMEAPQ